MKAFIAAVVVCASLAACASGYSAKGSRFGYTDTQIDTNVFRVTFQGNGYTSSTSAEEMALLRSAEVAIAHGFRYFVIVNVASRTDQIATPAISQAITTGNVNRTSTTSYVGSATTTTVASPGVVINFPASTNTIVCYAEKPTSDAFVYDASFIVKSLGKAYGR